MSHHLAQAEGIAGRGCRGIVFRSGRGGYRSPVGGATEWQRSEPSSGAGVLTLFRGSTFFIAGEDGLVRHGSQGLFHDDVRLLDRLQVHLVGQELEHLSLRNQPPDHAHALFRARPREGQQSQLLAALTWDLAPGLLTGRLVLRNLGPQPLPVHWVIYLSGDFAPMFAVKEGRLDDSALTGVTAAHGVIRFEGLGRTALATCPPAQARVDGFQEVVDLPAGEEIARELVIRCCEPTEGATIPQQARPRQWPAIHLDDDRARVVSSGLEDLAGLAMVDPESGRETVAAGAPWFMALFGRDSLLTSLMALPWWPGLAHGTLMALAARQGVRPSPLTEEQPGRILHETRLSGGSPLFHGGGSVYYGSTDATPLFVVLLAEASRWGMAKDDVERLLPAADAALDWCWRYGDRDGDGLIESASISARGLVNQGWKDSWNGIPGDDGRPAVPPLSLVEVQGYWYAALVGRADLARRMGDDAIARSCLVEAADLRQRIDEAFWSEEAGGYAVALDRGKKPAHALTSNAGHLLWTGAAAPRHVPALAAAMLSPRLRTAWGIRTLAEDHPAYNPLGYHVGAVWPHDTALIAWGLSRWGFHAAAGSVAGSVFAAASRLGGLPELYAGVTAADPVADGSPVPYPTACSPQAWASAAPLLLLRAVTGLEVDARDRRVLVAPGVPDSWEGLTWHGIPVAGLRITVRAARGAWQVAGLPQDWTTTAGCLFDPSQEEAAGAP